MKEIKFRQAIYLNGIFRSFHYWGFLESYGNIAFVGPITSASPKDALEHSRQFTGSLDKQGKEIYEGDITKTLYWSDNREGAICKGKVQWNMDDACFEIEWLSGTPYGKTDMLDISSNLEIIGNIWENPEILEEEKCNFTQ